jgi:hypothetical protein
MNCNKKIFFSIVVTLIFSGVVGALALEFYLQSNKYSDDVIQTEINSEIMDEERKVIVHLPENYEQNNDKSYPVMYVLDGTSQDAHTFSKIDLLSKINQFPESIVVGIPNTRGNRSRDFTPHYMKIDLEEPNSKTGNGNKFLAFIEKELIPFINKNYRTNGFQTISGNSRGGLFVMYALLEKPMLFNGYICYSPAFWREDNLIAKKVKTFFEQNQMTNKFIYMSIGDEENKKMRNGFNVVNTILEKEFADKSNRNLRLISQVTQNANHGNNSYKSTIYALNFLNNFLIKS